MLYVVIKGHYPFGAGDDCAREVVAICNTKEKAEMVVEKITKSYLENTRYKELRLDDQLSIEEYELNEAYISSPWWLNEDIKFSV